MKKNLHPLDPEWEELVRIHYGEAYPELVSVFRQLLVRAFFRTYWIPDPLAMDYLVKILIRFLPVTSGKERIEEALSLCDVASDDPQETIRFYETVGELILWWSGLYRKPVYRSEGKRVFEIAYERLADYEEYKAPVLVLPGQPPEKMSSKRLQINKLFSEQFENFQELLERSDLLNDPAFQGYRATYVDPDICIN